MFRPIRHKTEETKEQRIQRVDQLLDHLIGFDLILLPEIWATGYFSFDKYKEQAEELYGPFTQGFSNKAKQSI
jgi:predicted amidohydrolase